MDISALLSTLTNSESISGLAQAADVSADSAKGILSSALPSLLSGALSQSTNDETSASFADALTQHADSDTSSIASFLSSVDLTDGGKIISHLLVDDASSTLSQVAEKTGTSTQQTSNVLSAAAPLLMSLLGQQTSSQQASGTGIGSIMSSLMGSTDVSSLLTGLLGGGTAAAAEDTLTEVTNTAAAAAQEEKKTGLWGAILNLFK
mgnify:CR=1 FL=1